MRWESGLRFLYHVSVSSMNFTKKNVVVSHVSLNYKLTYLERHGLSKATAYFVQCYELYASQLLFMKAQASLNYSMRCHPALPLCRRVAHVKLVHAKNIVHGVEVPEHCLHQRSRINLMRNIQV